jgi:hypothetical protein
MNDEHRTEVMRDKDTVVRVSVERTAREPREKITVESSWNSDGDDMERFERMTELACYARVLADQMIDDMNKGIG